MPYDVVDAHLQVWDPETVHYPWMAQDPSLLHRAYRVADVGGALHEHHVDGVVLVQSADNRADSENLLFQALSSPDVVGVVGWVPLDRPDEAATQLDHWRAEPLVGVSHHIDREPDARWLVRDVVDDGLHMLTERRLVLDLPATTPELLRHVATVAERHPKLTVVVDHLGGPPLGALRAGDTATWSRWTAALDEVAQVPNVVAKLAGLGRVAGPGWTADDVRPAVDHALAAFGPDRLMAGSDWPSALRGQASWEDAWRAVRATLDGLDDVGRARVLGRTAVEVYGIPVLVAG
ncbi:amidohydrolase family protein [Cellulomonas shaoxiangyii]|uniref:Amidohydrolase n=1 Tax=Cellulomonas shaoxiangyii TaxID=2566013 RepID=A0A4P7SFB4_9CELL|nr:amidohydrolase family protein [Cellulomonas shaoxiangyii]QCB92580.1 amidohydrolase [Cellulomonas shaoxiangyii]TGY82813.1 amidohydrolase [Cellulomonas shaoxiangyii]